MNADNWKENTGDVDHWTLMANGDLVEDEDGWLRDQNGNFIIDKDRKKIGDNGIETGLLNILFGEKQEDGSMKNSGKSYSSFSDEQIATAQALMYGAGFTNDGKENPRDVTWNKDKNSGNTIKADLIADGAGNTVATQVFMNIFDNLTNGMIDNTSLRYTAFQSYSREDYAARLTNYFSAKYSFYNGEHKLFNNTDDLRWAQDFGPSSLKIEGENVYKDNYHKGIDIIGKEGTEIYALYGGLVTGEKLNTSSSGYSIILNYGFNFENAFYDTGIFAQFMHFSKESLLNVGDYVTSNMVIGSMGNTGVGTGTHLHYQLMGNLPGIGENNVKWNMLDYRRDFFLNKFGYNGAIYSNAPYYNYYYNTNNLKEVIGL
jgi:murein DD-endopeptidase MepM/ murein hydrolase activator NlpD